MASLRRRPTPDPMPEAETVADAAPVAVANTDPAPAPQDTPAAPSLAQFAEGGALTPDPSLKRQLEALKNSEELARQQAIAASVEQRRQQWLSSNELAKQNYGALADLHQHALNAGLIDTSPAYFTFMDRELASLQSRHAPPIEEMQARIAENREPEPPQPRQRVPMVSAPVSREYNGTGGSYGGSHSRIKLSPAQCEMARMAGISEAEYAKQLQKLNEMKRNGDYAERR